MHENREAALEMRLKKLEQKVSDLEKELRNLTTARPQRDTSASPRPQRNATHFGGHDGEDENPFRAYGH